MREPIRSVHKDVKIKVMDRVLERKIIGLVV